MVELISHIIPGIQKEKLKKLCAISRPLFCLIIERKELAIWRFKFIPETL